MADVDAPTTLPATTGSPGLVERLGGVVLHPVRALRALEAHERAHPTEPLALYAVVVLAIHAAESYRALALLGEAPWIATRRLVDVIWRAGRTDLVVIAVAAAVVAAIGRWRGRRPLGVFVAVTYLAIPLALLKAAGGLLALAGVEVWALPHRAVDSMAVFVGGALDVGRFVVKCVVAYGSGLATLLVWLATLARPLEPPRAVRARAGAAVAVAVIGALVVGAIGQVLSRRDALRPKLGGDVFPSVALPRLEKAGRVDVVKRLGGDTRVVVVDFWASWCGPCKRSLPELSQVAADYADRGVVVIGVNREPTDQDAARAAWRAIGPSFESLIDTAGLGERLGLTSLPTSYIVGADGRIRHVHLGYTEPAVLRAELDALLAAP